MDRVAGGLAFVVMVVDTRRFDPRVVRVAVVIHVSLVHLLESQRVG